MIADLVIHKNKTRFWGITISFIVGVLTSFFLTTIQARANTISEIKMNVYIDENGNASVTEVWEGLLTEGTEGYKSYTNLGDMSISNFNVSDDSGNTYDCLSSWRTGADFDQKAYKCGIHPIEDGMELCWGISDYGNRVYTLKYDINNFVTQYTDAQGIYFNFLNLDQYVGEVKITIRSDVAFSEENAKIWAFGYDGEVNFKDGKIVLDSGGFLADYEYMVGLIKFESDLFNTSGSSNQSFDEIYNSAMSDVSESELESDSASDDSDSGSGFFGFLTLFSMIGIFLFNPIIWVGVVFLVVLRKKGTSWLLGNRKLTGSLDFGTYGNILPGDKQIDYWREIPCNKDLERAYWVAYNYNVVSKDTLKEGMIGAILLKWMKDGLITVTKTKNGLFNLKDNNYAIDFSNMRQAENELENDLFKMLKEASGSNSILEAKEFKKWCKKNYSEVHSWFYGLEWREQYALEKQGLIVEAQEETTGMFGSRRTIMVKRVDPQLREDAIQLSGLRKFLWDYSMMPEREYFEVHIWEEYLIYAQLLGVADKVEQQFSRLYPDFNQQTNLDIGITTVAVRDMAHLGYRSYREGKRAHDYSISSSSGSSGRSSGSGGSSYSSGGSSAGGSSGGGFR